MKAPPGEVLDAEPGRPPPRCRSELLIKLALLERANTGPADLLRRQQDQLLPIAAAIDDELQETTGFERTLALCGDTNRYQRPCAS
jgi:hypothetical protein